MPEQDKAGEVTSSNWLEEAAAAQPEKPEEPKPEEPTEPEPQAKEKVEEKVEKVVPLAALHEERAKRREAVAREQAMAQQIEQLRREQIQWMQRAQQPPQPAPDQATDPMGALIHSQTQTAAQLEAMRQEKYQEQQRAVQEQQMRSFVSAVQAQAAEFIAKQPDADEGINFLKSGRVEEYKAMGMSQREATQRMLHDEWQLSQWALQNGENPAQVAYNMAVARGYVAPDKKLEMQQRGQQASTPSGGGGKGGGTPSLDALLKMNGKDFAKATEGDNWEKLMKKHGA